MQRLRTHCEQAKLILSSCTDATVEINHLFDGIDFACNISRAQFEDMNLDYFQKFLQLVRGILHDAGMERENIHDVVLVGGSTRIPKIQELLTTFFNGKQLSRTVNQVEAASLKLARWHQLR